MKRTLGLVLLAAIAGGCGRNVYDIELDPAGNALERKLTVRQQSRSDSDAPEAFNEVVNRIAAEYGATAPRPGKVHVFRGRFSGKLPNDVGGSGTFSHWDTPLGSASMYVERFRGTDDVVGILKRRQASADRLTDLLVAWLQLELNGDAQWPGLKRFLHEDLRHDLQNLAVYAWTVHIGHKTDDYVEPAMRILQYLVERGYVEPGEIPAFTRALSDATGGTYQRLMTWGSAFLAARTGGTALNMPESLSTPEKWRESLSAFLEKTEDYATLTKTWPQKHPGAEEPEGLDVTAELVAEMLLGGMELRLGSDQVAVALNTGRPVLFTNGQWSAESAKITWPSRPLTADGLPPVTYAIWDDPDEVGQQSHFGAVVLQGQPLLEYCIWYRGLTAAEREEWDELIDKLGPDSEHAQLLRSFRFSHEPADLAKDERLSSAVVESILAGLKSKR